MEREVEDRRSRCLTKALIVVDMATRMVPISDSDTITEHIVGVAKKFEDYIHDREGNKANRREKVAQAVGEYSGTVMMENPTWAFNPVQATKLVDQIMEIIEKEEK